MKKSKKNEEIQSRREFFKNAAHGALPILTLTVLGPTVFSSCEKEKTKESSGCGKSSCRGGCDSSCSGSCDEDCTDICAYGCSGTCHGHTRSY